MYNEKIKQQYIDSLDGGKNSKENAKSVFRDIETLELKYNEDAFCIPKDIIAKYFAKKAKSLATLQNKMSRINRYKRWANKNGLVPDDYKAFVYEKCNIGEIYRKYNSTVIFHTPSELKKMLDENFPARHESGVTLDELASAYIILLFQGIREDDVLDITISDVSVKNNSISISTPDEDIIIYSEFEDLIRKIYCNRIYMCLSNNDYGTKEMDDRFIDNGKGKMNKALKIDICKHISTKTLHLRYKISDIYLMGMIFKGKMKAGDNFERNDVLKACYGDSWTEKTRMKLYDLIKQW